MKKLRIVVGVVALALSLNLAWAASISLTLTPSTATFTSGELVEVDVTVWGLPAGGPPSVGAFDLTVAFDAGVLKPLGVEFGAFLGDASLFEALTGFDPSIPGLIEFAEVSLLAPDALDALQPASFNLATLLFEAIADGTSGFAFFGDRRIDDAFGIKLVVIPEPSMIVLLALGAGLLGAFKPRGRAMR